jgi:hypothetical protein
MLGSGRRKAERILYSELSAPEELTEWETLDINESVNPTYVFDLENLERGENLPCGDYDEIHAYSVLEHFGRQGNYRGLINTFSAIWKALKRNGILFGWTPQSAQFWTWGDPGHCRVITQQTLHYLTKKYNARKNCTDYSRFIEPYWWKVLRSEVERGRTVFAMGRDNE